MLKKKHTLNIDYARINIVINAINIELTSAYNNNATIVTKAADTYVSRSRLSSPFARALERRVLPEQKSNVEVTGSLGYVDRWERDVVSLFLGIATRVR